MSTRQSIAREVLAEEDRQDSLWGDQSHMPNGTGPDVTPLLGWYEAPSGVNGDGGLLLATFAQLATFAKHQTAEAASDGLCTWQRVLLEEVLEALAELDPAGIRGELVQVSAVAQQWVAAIDKKHGRFVEPIKTKFTPAHAHAFYLLAEHPEGLTHGRLFALWQAKAARVKEPWPWISESGARTRVSELARWGIVERSGREGRTNANRPCAIWQLSADFHWAPPAGIPGTLETFAALHVEAGSNVIVASLLDALEGAR